MTDPGLHARARLWEYVGFDDDFSRYTGFLVDACERVGLIASDEAEQWRRLNAGAEPPTPAAGDFAAAERHLEALLAAVPPISRDDDPAARTAGQRVRGALRALHAAGVLSDEAQRRWHMRVTAASAPWLDQQEPARLEAARGATLIAIPPASPEEAASDAAALDVWELLARRGEARRVYVAERLQRVDGLAILAVVTRTDSTEVHFHHLGEPRGDDRFGSAFRAAVESLVPPKLSDDHGTGYAPASQQPASAHGVGGIPDPHRPEVITGTWRYQPPALDPVNAFTIETPAARWRATGSG